MTSTTQIVTVTTAGTPVQLPAPPNPPVGVDQIFIQIDKGSTIDGTHSGYVGTSALTKATAAGVIFQFTGAAGTFNLGGQEARNQFIPSDLWLDADTNGTRFLVTYWQS